MAGERGPVLSSIAALGTLTAAVSCCLPVGTLLAAAGAAGAARVLAPLRPWLIGISVAALITGFVQMYRRSRCSLRRNPFTMGLLWIAAVFVITMLLFPQAIAGFLADRFPSK